MNVERGTLNDVLGLLVSLVDKSLVQVEEGSDGEMRYRLLEMVRQYGLERLEEQGETAPVRSQHRDYFLAFAEEAEPHVTGPGQAEALKRLEREHDNLRAALTWCLDQASTGDGDREPGLPGRASVAAELGARLAGALWRFWFGCGLYAEGRRWLEQALAALPSDQSSSVRSAQAKARFGAAQLAAYQGEYRTAVGHMDEALALCQETGNEPGVAMALGRLGFYRAHVGEYERALQLREESIVLARQLGDTLTLANMLRTAGIVAWFVGQFERAAAFSEENLDLCRTIGSPGGIAHSLLTLGSTVGELGDGVRAAALVEEGLRVSREIGDKRGVADSFKHLGRAALLDGDVDRATEMFQASIPIFQETGDRWNISRCLHDLAGVRTLQGTREPGARAADGAPTDGAAGPFLDAARLFATAGVLRELDGLALPLPLRGAYDGDLAILRDNLGEAVFAEAWAEGRAMTLEQAAEYALAIPISSTPAAVDESIGAGGSPARTDVARLTLREREIAALVARGLSNRRIAEELVLSERTVDTHVHHILGKLELSSRAQIAAWSVEHGLTGLR